MRIPEDLHLIQTIREGNYVTIQILTEKGLAFQSILDSSNNFIDLNLNIPAYTAEGERIAIHSLRVFNNEGTIYTQAAGYTETGTIMIHGDTLYKKDPRPYLSTAGKVLYGT